MFTKMHVFTLVWGLCLYPRFSDALAAKQGREKRRALPKNDGADLSSDALVGDTEAMASQFDTLMAGAMTEDFECDPKAKLPKLKDCTDTEKTMEWYFEAVNWNSCQIGLNLTDMEAGEAITAPLGTLISTCTDDKDFTAVESPFCVERFAEGDYNGTLSVPAEIAGGFQGGTNQYAWATDFNEDIGFGIVIHSTGSPGALTSSYSLPTFTVRDRNASVVYEGIYGDPNTQGTPVNVGLRSAIILDFDETTSVLSILAATIEIPNGQFLQFDLNLNDFTGTPVSNVVPVLQSPFVAPSVRAALRVSNDYVLYAPLFDVGGSTGNPFLKLFNVRTFESLPTSFFITDIGIDSGLSEQSLLQGLVWDFDCATGGQCFINVISISDPDESLAGDEDAVPTTSFFPLSIVEDFVNATVSAPGSLEPVEFIPSTIVDPGFTVDYSAQSFQPIDENSSLVCTLSGFLFRIGFAGPTILGEVIDGNQGLSILELGEGQECSICTVEYENDNTRDLMKDKKKGKAKSKVTKSKVKKKKKGDLPGDAMQDNDGTAEEVGLGVASGSCEPVEIVDQPLTTAYVWAIEECAGKIFVGTYDIASVFGGIFDEVLISQGASVACQNPEVVAQICGAIACPENNLSAAAQICRNIASTAASAFLENSPTIRQSLEALLDTNLVGSQVSAGDFGFDLYYIEKEDLTDKNPELIPVTQNGFRTLSPSGPEDPFASFFPFPFDPTTQADPAIRNMVCHRDPQSGEERLVIGSAVFNKGLSSNTYVLDPNCSPDR